jgi:hypothetical protein
MSMAIDYDEFRRTTWEERTAIFSALSAEGKAELFRSQVWGWLARHRAELTPAQIELLDEAVAVAVPELYASPKPEQLVARMKDFEKRARALLNPAQCIDALTMQWGLT